MHQEALGCRHAFWFKQDSGAKLDDSSEELRRHASMVFWRSVRRRSCVCHLASRHLLPGFVSLLGFQKIEG